MKLWQLQLTIVALGAAFLLALVYIADYPTANLRALCVKDRDPMFQRICAEEVKP